MAEVTWLGHAGVLVEVDGVRVLLDPLLTRRQGRLRRRGPLPDADVRRADLVVISHAHADHLHRRSLRLVAGTSPAVPVVVPRGAAPLRRGAGSGTGRRGPAGRRPGRGRRRARRDRCAPPRRPDQARPRQHRDGGLRAGAGRHAGSTSPGTPTCSTRWRTSTASTSRRSRSRAGGAGSVPATSTRRGPPRRWRGSTRAWSSPSTGAPTPRRTCGPASRAGPSRTGVGSPRSSPGGGWRTGWCGSEPGQTARW